MRLREEGAADGVDPIAEGLAGLSLITARAEDETAAAAALLLREALETPGRTAALITPDAVLARRVSARLARWGIVVELLGRRAPGRFPRRRAGRPGRPGGGRPASIRSSSWPSSSTR